MEYSFWLYKVLYRLISYKDILILLIKVVYTALIINTKPIRNSLR